MVNYWIPPQTQHLIPTFCLKQLSVLPIPNKMQVLIKLGQLWHQNLQPVTQSETNLPLQLQSFLSPIFLSKTLFCNYEIVVVTYSAQLDKSTFSNGVKKCCLTSKNAGIVKCQLSVLNGVLITPLVWRCRLNKGQIAW